MASDNISSKFAWEVIKVVEEDDNGELHLLQDNFDSLLQLVKKKEYGEVPIIFTAFLGPQPSGKQLFTNLFSTYAACNGQGWSSQVKKNGLKKFELSSIIPTQSSKLNPEIRTVDTVDSDGKSNLTKFNKSSDETALTELRDVIDKILKLQLAPTNYEDKQRKAILNLMRAARFCKNALSNPMKTSKDPTKTTKQTCTKEEKRGKNINTDFTPRNSGKEDEDLGSLSDNYVFVDKDNFEDFQVCSRLVQMHHFSIVHNIIICACNTLK